MWEKWAVDVTIPTDDGIFCFVPIEGDPDGEHTLVVGMNFLSDKPPPDGKLVAVAHMDGQEAVENWIRNHPIEMARLFPEQMNEAFGDE